MAFDPERFGGIQRLVGQRGADALGRARVCVVGVGGVGTWAAEALARSGVGCIGLVDLDDACVTNTNRQLHATSATVGLPKVRAMADRIGSIAPGCEVVCVEEFFTPDTAAPVLAHGWDWVVDAIDHVGNKAALVEACLDAGVGVVVSGGAGGRMDPGRIRAGDLGRTGGDGLLRALRQRLRGRFGQRDHWGVPAVYSDERQRFPGADGEPCDVADGSGPRRLDCASGYGTASFVTGVFGLVAASVVVRAIADAAAGAADASLARVDATATNPGRG